MAHPAEGDLTNYKMTSPLRVAKHEDDSFDADPFRRSLPIGHAYDPAAVVGEIQFQRRAHEASRGMRSLYGGAAPPTLPDVPPSPTSLAHQDAARFAGRKQSLVRPEDYMAPTPHYNPYVARSWAEKPDDLDLDLELDRASIGRARFDSIALPGPDPVATEADIGTEVMPRKLGGKRIYTGAEWRKQLQAETAQSPTPSPQPLSEAAITLPAGDVPVFAVSFSGFDPDSDDDEKKVRSGPAIKVIDEKDVDFYREGQPSDVIVLPPSRTSTCKSRATFGFITAILAQLTMAVYLGFRLAYIILSQRRTGGRYLSAWLFLGVEVTFACRNGLATLKSILGRAGFGAAFQKRLRVRGDIDLPRIDVLVLATGQSDQMVMDTAIAAAKLDWPVDKLRVLVLDDVNSRELQRRAETYSNNRALHLTYHRRVTPPRGANSKAGLINYGLTETRINNRTPGDFVLVLEADTIPDPDMLRGMMPHMLASPSVALGRCAQGYYNLPVRLSGSLATIMRAAEPASDIRSGFVVRRTALDDVGGFPTGSSIEDGQLAVLLAGKGYKTTSVHESLHFGLALSSYSTQIRQRLDRSLGPVRAGRRLRLFSRGRRLQYLPLVTRIQAIAAMLQPILTFDVLVCTALIPASIWTGQFIVPVATLAQLNTLIRVFFVASLFERVHELTFCLATGEPTARALTTSRVFMAPYQILNMVRAAFAGLPVAPFEYADKPMTAATKPRSLGRRLASVFLEVPSWLHMVLVGAVASSVIVAIVRICQPVSQGLRSSHQALLLLLLSVGWPSMLWLWITVLRGCLVPITYALFPPTIPPREHLLVRDPITSIARPLPEWRRRRPFPETHLGDALYTVASVAYVAVLFALTFNNSLAL